MLRILHLGFGEIGRAVVHSILQRPAAAVLCAIVDPDPKLAGKNLSDLLGSQAPSILIAPTIADALRNIPKPDVAIVTTGSRMETVSDTFYELSPPASAVSAVAKNWHSPDCVIRPSQIKLMPPLSKIASRSWAPA